MSPILHLMIKSCSKIKLMSLTLIFLGLSWSKKQQNQVMEVMDIVSSKTHKLCPTKFLQTQHLPVNSQPLRPLQQGPRSSVKTSETWVSSTSSIWKTRKAMSSTQKQIFLKSSTCLESSVAPLSVKRITRSWLERYLMTGGWGRTSCLSFSETLLSQYGPTMPV